MMVYKDLYTKEDKLEKLVNFLKEKFPDGIQMFDTRNWVGDEMTTIYEDSDITVDYAVDYGYIEIFGLTDDSFERVMEEIGGYQ